MAKNLVGVRVGRLVVQAFFISYSKRRHWLCLCDCGNTKYISTYRLTSNTVRSCGCLRIESARRLNRIEYGLASKNNVFRDYKYGAKKRELEFELDFDTFVNLASQNCYYCDSKPSNLRKSKVDNGNFMYNGIDRIDNAKGYTKTNSVPCCKECNSSKRNRTIEDFLLWVSQIYKRHCEIK